MLCSRLKHVARTWILGYLTALLLLPADITAQTTITYTNGQTDATNYSVATPNDPTTLSITSGTATQSGNLSGVGSVFKTGAGTLILTGVNTYSLGTTINSGSLEVATTGSITHSGASMTVGEFGTGVLNLTGGSVSNSYGYLGLYSGSSGTANVSSGTWTNSRYLYVGLQGTGVLNLTGGGVSNSNGYLGYNSGSSGTATVSGGTWTNNSALIVGLYGTGVLNLTGGTVHVGGVAGTGTVTIASQTGSSGTLNLGTGGTAGTLNAATVSGGDGTALVNFNHTGNLTFAPVLTGSLSVTKLGSGTTTLSKANTYTGNTTVNDGTLALAFGTVTSDILPSSTALTLGGGTLQLTGTGTQTVNGLTTTASTGSIILMGSGQTLTLGTLTTGDSSALNFNTAAGGANGATVGTGLIVLTGQTAGDAINSGFTVTDSKGFGLATVNGSDQVIRLTNTTLLPASGAVSGTDYRIDNNNGGTASDGSRSLAITASQSANSITVDTSAANGVVTLASGVVQSTNVWNFGGTGSNTWQISGSAGGAGLQSVNSGDTIQINNFNTGAVTLAAPILDNGGTGVNLKGTGTTVFAGVNTYEGGTTVAGGTLEVATGGSITHFGADMTVGEFGTGVLNLTGGSVSNGSGFLGASAGSSGTANVSSGSWTSSRDLNAGYYGTGVLNLSGGSVSNSFGYFGTYTGSSGTANVSGGTWTNSRDLTVGNEGTGVLNLTGGSVSNANGYLGTNSGSSGTATVSGGTWTNSSDLFVGYGGTGVLNLTGGSVSNATGYLGTYSGSSGTATVSSGTWTNSRDLRVGFLGTGVLNLTGGTVHVGGVAGTGSVTLGNSSGNSGTLNLGTGGTAGTLNAATVKGADGTAVVNFNHTGSYTFDPLLNGSLAVNMLGAGTTVLTGTNTYSGATTVTAGVLLINGDNSGATGTVTVQNGGTLGGSGTIGGAITVQNGGTLAPGGTIGTLTGTSATFSSGSLFALEGGGAFFDRLNLSGAATLTPGALISFSITTALTQSSYTLMTAASGLDDTNAFTLSGALPTGYVLDYTGTALNLKTSAPPAIPAAYWKGDVTNNWSSLTTGNSNWATAPDGATDTGILPGAITDVTFSASGAVQQTTTLDVDFTIKSLTITDPAAVTIAGSNKLTVSGAAGSGIDVQSGAGLFTLGANLKLAGSSDTITVNNAAGAVINGTVESDNGLTKLGTGVLVLSASNTYTGTTNVNAGALAITGSMSGAGNVTVAANAFLTGDGSLTTAVDQSVFLNGTLNVQSIGSNAAATFSVTTSGTGALVLGAGSFLAVDILTGAGMGDNTATKGASDTLNLNGTLNATAGGTLLLGNPNHMTGFHSGDKWQVVDLNDGDGSIVGTLALNDSAVGLSSTQAGKFDQATGVYSVVDTASGLQTAALQDQSVLSTVQNALGDLNGRLFNLRAGGIVQSSAGSTTASADDSAGIGNSLYATIDDGVVFGYGDGPEDHKVAKKVLRAYQWEVYTTVNYANVSLNTMGTQAGVDAQTWSPSVGIERYVTEHLAVGFAVSLMNTHQKYANSLGGLDMQGVGLSAYASYVRSAFWVDALYSFGRLDLDSTRNPGVGIAAAMGETTAYTNSVQLNGGWNFRFQNNTLVTGPFAGLDYMHATVNAYSETGGGIAALSYGSRSFDSLVSRIGWSVSKKFTTGFAVITPQFRLSYERQNMSNNNATSATLVNLPFTATTQSQAPGQDYMVAGGGVNFEFNDRLSLLLTYQTQLFRQGMTAHFAGVRLSYKF